MSHDEVVEHKLPPLESIKTLMREVARRCPDGKLPDHYIVFDTETTHWSPEYAVVLQYAFVTIVHRAPSQEHPPVAAYVAQPRSVPIPPDAAKINGLSHEKIAGGHPPHLLAPVLADVIEDFVSNRLMIAGHNVQAYDMRIVKRLCTGIQRELRAGTNMVLDTGMLVKAAQIGMKPGISESLEAFYDRVAQLPRTIKWSLDRYCYSAFQLHRFLPKDKMHDAAADCIASHLVLEELRKLGGL